MIRIGIVGVGNIASMLVQSIEYYKNNHGIPGVIHEIIGGYKVGDLEVVYAIDISREKVSKDISEAIFAKPNITPKLVDIDKKGVIVRMGKILDGVADHMVEDFMPANEREPSAEELVDELRSAKVDVLINLLPVGSAQASRFYAKVAAMANAAFINSIPEFIASDKEYCKLFEENSSLILGDDIKGQLGSTIVHRTLASLISMRGGKIIESYQLNIGGNTDFKNMVDISRLTSKKISKTMAVASTQPSPEEVTEKIFAGPSGYIPFLGNTKISYIYIKAKMFMGLSVTIDLKLTVDDKAMATPILIDAIRIAKVLKDRGIYGCPDWASAPYFKHPPRQAKSDEEALLRLYMKLEDLGIQIHPKRLPILDLLSLKL